VKQAGLVSGANTLTFNALHHNSLTLWSYLADASTTQVWYSIQEVIWCCEWQMLAGI